MAGRTFAKRTFAKRTFAKRNFAKRTFAKRTFAKRHGVARATGVSTAVNHRNAASMYPCG